MSKIFSTYSKFENSSEFSVRRFLQRFWYAGITHCLSGLAVFFSGRVACQTVIQIQAYTIPLIFVSPMTI